MNILSFCQCLTEHFYLVVLDECQYSGQGEVVFRSPKCVSKEDILYGLTLFYRSNQYLNVPYFVQRIKFPFIYNGRVVNQDSKYLEEKSLLPDCLLEAVIAYLYHIKI